jgi:protein-L-isoaspartate(D-aspartate) O-methyltransferase
MPSVDVCAAQRHHRVETQLVALSMWDPAVLAAMRTVPREVCVPPELVDCACEDCPLPIGDGQTLAPPSSVVGITAARRLPRMIASWRLALVRAMRPRS